MNKFFLLISLTPVCGMLSAQIKNPFTKGEDSLSLENSRIENEISAEKSKTKIDRKKSIYRKPEFKYSDISFFLKINPEKIKPVFPTINLEKPKLEKANYASLSYGNFASPEGLICLNTRKQKNLIAGAQFQHLSSWRGYLKNTEFMLNSFEGALESRYNKVNVVTGLEINKTDYSFFGDSTHYHEPTGNDSLSGELLKINSFLTLKSNSENSKISPRANFGVRFTGDKYGYQEMWWSINPGVTYNLSQSSSVVLNSSLQIYKDTLGNVKSGKSIVEIFPYYQLKKKNFSIATGFNVLSFYDSTSNNSIFPFIETELLVIPSRLRFTGKINGGFTYNSFYNLTESNIYYSRYAQTAGSTFLKLLTGVNGNFAGKWNYSLNFTFSKTALQPVWVNRTLPEYSSRFDLVYGKDLTTLGISSSNSILFSENLSALVSFDFCKYQFGEASPISIYFNQQQINGNVGLKLKIKRVISLEPQVQLIGKIPLYEDLTQKVISQKEIVLLNLSGNYYFSNRFSLFLKLGNLLNTRYFLKAGYQEAPLTMRGGVFYTF